MKLNPIKISKDFIGDSFRLPFKGIVQGFKNKMDAAEDDDENNGLGAKDRFLHAMAHWKQTEADLPAIYKRMLISFWATFTPASITFLLVVASLSGAIDLRLVSLLALIAGTIMAGSYACSVALQAWHVRTMSLSPPSEFFRHPGEWLVMPLFVLADDRDAEQKYPILKIKQ